MNLSSSYHPQIDGQIERVNQILEQYLRYSLRYQQDDWIDLLPLVELTFNNTIHGSTGVTPFFSNYGFNISIPGNSVNPSTEERARTLANIHQDVSLQLILLGNRYKAQAYQHRSAAPSFVVGDQLWLLHRHIDTTRPCGKLDYKKLDPVTFWLELPPHFRIHNVFHVSLLEPHHPSTILGRYSPPPPPIELSIGEEYEVDQILDYRWHRQQL